MFIHETPQTTTSGTQQSSLMLSAPDADMSIDPKLCNGRPQTGDSQQLTRSAGPLGINYHGPSPGPAHCAYDVFVCGRHHEYY